MGNVVLTFAGAHRGEYCSESEDRNDHGGFRLKIVSARLLRFYQLLKVVPFVIAYSLLLKINGQN